MEIDLRTCCVADVNFKVTAVRLWMAAVLPTGLNPPSLSWSFHAYVTGVSEESLQTSISKPTQAA